MFNAEDKDWVETVNFGSIQEVFKLDNGAQYNVLAKVAYEKITTKHLEPSLARLESCSKTCIRPVGKVSCLVGCVGKGIKYVFKCLIEITCPSWVDHPVRIWV